MSAAALRICQLLLGLVGIVQAAPLEGPWYTGSNRGTPNLSATNASAFTWGSVSGAADTANTGALWQNMPGISLTNDYQFVRFAFALNPHQVPTGGSIALRFGLFDHMNSLRTENLDGVNTDNAFLPYRGYWTGRNLAGTSSAQIGVRTGDATNPLSSTGTSTLQAISRAGTVTQTGVWYEASFRILREPDDALLLTSILDGVTNEVRTTNLSPELFNFVMIQNTSASGVDGLDVTNLVVETGFVTPPTPDPPVDLSTRPNVLFICVDDLRPETGAYGEQHMITPHLDRLAQEGRLFQNHFVQSPTCGASRYAMLTGRRYGPTDSGNRNNNTLLNRAPTSLPAEAWSIPDLFRRAGYQTVGLGKIGHTADGYNYGTTLSAYPANLVPEMPFSWSELIIPPSFISKWGTGWKAFFGYADGSSRTPGTSPPFEIGDPQLHRAPLYPDTDIADTAVQKLMSFGTNRFFMAVGFYKPHLPFNAPKAFYDLYDTNSLPFAPFTGTSIGIDSRTNSQSGEPVNNYGHPASESGWANQEKTFYHAQLRHAYFACVSYMDAQVGKVLDTLDETGLSTNTVVVVWGDHGWHLGDNNLWGKHTMFERAARSALIIRTPQMRFRGYPTQALTESIDLFPTLAELAELTPPSHLDGESLVPILEDPNHPGKDAAITYWHPASSLRTDRYRMVYYHNDDTVELFDHRLDPYEQTNLAFSASYSNVLVQLREQSISNTVTMQAAPDHYRTWLTNFFSTVELANEAMVGPLANADGDPFVNLAEYARGQHPRIPDVARELRPVVTNGHFAVQLERSLLATDTQTTLQASGDLDTWEDMDVDDLSHRLERTQVGERESLMLKGPPLDPLYLRLKTVRP